MPSYSTGFWVAATRNGRGQRAGDAVDRDLALLHRLEQRGLGLGRRPVDLVGQQQVGEDRALAEGQLAAWRLSITSEPVMSPGIRSGVNCTRLVSTDERRGEGAHQQRLGDAGHALHQHVAAAEQRDEQAGDGGVLADDGLADLGAHGGEPLAGRPRPVVHAVSVMYGVPLCRARPAAWPG